MTRQEDKAKGEQMPLVTKATMYSTHRQPSGCINTNMFTQALNFLMMNNPSHCEKEMWTVLNPARVHAYVRLELSVNIKTGGGGGNTRQKNSITFCSTLQIFRDIFHL